jgi:TolA-binding protein
MKSVGIGMVVVVFFIAGCAKLSENDLWTKVEQTRADGNYDSTIQVCKQILKDYPDGQKTSSAIYSLAETYQDRLQDFRTAVSYYSLFAQKFPNDTLAPAAMFLVGFLYNNDLQMYDSARDAYQQFLDKFPNNELASSARFELTNLGKSPEELLPPETAPEKSGSKVAVKRKKKTD